MNGGKKELFSTKVIAGRRTYFFDVKESSNAKYLVITESKQVGETYEHNRIFIFQEYIPSFVKGLKDALEFIKG
ncbi:MAG TPA: DUF3276 family protein [Archaeoglobaceae archaeon]|nr:DUF3276 family protein [Archaeoglobaceae archaeon]